MSKPQYISELKTNHRAEIPWLWEGYIARGSLTLLTAQWKTGKTTLLSRLLAKMDGGGTFLGRPVKRSQSIILSEESPKIWLARDAELSMGDNFRIHSNAFEGRPTFEKWDEWIDNRCKEFPFRSFDLLVIDPLSMFMPMDSENDSKEVMRALEPLRLLLKNNIAILLIHHPSKGRKPTGQSARGSGVWSSAADINLEMHPVNPDDPLDRRRQLLGFSRFRETPCRTRIEWNADGRDYTVLTRPTKVTFCRIRTRKPRSLVGVNRGNRIFVGRVRTERIGRFPGNDEVASPRKRTCGSSGRPDAAANPQRLARRPRPPASHFAGQTTQQGRRRRLNNQRRHRPEKLALPIPPGKG